MKNNKIVAVSVALLSAFSLTVVGTTITQTNVQTATKHTSKATKKAMNLDQIKKGNYSSIKGNWAQVASYSPKRTSAPLQFGGDDVVKVTKSSLSGAGIKLSGSTLTDNNGSSHPLEFQKRNKALIASLKDSDTAVNYSVTFYPKGTNTEFQGDNKKNDKNLIAIWTSNNNYTEVFAQDSNSKATNKKNTKKSAAPATKKQNIPLNLAQIQDNNFSSLQGTWQNAAGKTLDVTNQTEDRPDDFFSSCFKRGYFSR